MYIHPSECALLARAKESISQIGLRYGVLQGGSRRELSAARHKSNIGDEPAWKGSVL